MADGFEQGRIYAQPVGEHVSLGRTLRGVLFLIPVILVALILLSQVSQHTLSFGWAIALGIVFLLAWNLLISGVRIAAQWERGVVLRLGKFRNLRGPGIMYIVPILEYIRFIDTRTLVLNIPRQKVITRDNVPAEIDGALFFRVIDAERAVVSIQDYRFAIAQYAQATLRDVVGGHTLDELLSEREAIQQQIGINIEAHIHDWGLQVDSIRLQDIELPEDLKRMMSRQASAEREKRATITKAEGDKLAAVNLSEAAQTMRASPGAMQLRTLQTVDGLGPSASNTVVLFPVEWIDLVTRLLHARDEPAE